MASCSHSSGSETYNDKGDDCLDDLNLKLRDDEANEIARLELSTEEAPDANTSMEGETREPNEKDDDERDAGIEFECVSCGLREMVHYFGKEPPFVKGVKYLENTYVMRDPFKPAPPRWKTKPEDFVALGAKCFNCRKTFCKDADCSFFYTRTYCLRCAGHRMKLLPPEAQSRLRKQISEN